MGEAEEVAALSDPIPVRNRTPGPAVAEDRPGGDFGFHGDRLPPRFSYLSEGKIFIGTICFEFEGVVVLAMLVATYKRGFELARKRNLTRKQSSRT